VLGCSYSGRYAADAPRRGVAIDRPALFFSGYRNGTLGRDRQERLSPEWAELNFLVSPEASVLREVEGLALVANHAAHCAAGRVRAPAPT